MICDRCHEYFEDDPGDMRPFLFHVCSDGFLMAHRNPRFNSHRRGEPCVGEQRSHPVQYTYDRKVYDK